MSVFPSVCLSMQVGPLGRRAGLMGCPWGPVYGVCHWGGLGDTRECFKRHPHVWRPLNYSALIAGRESNLV